MPTADAASVRSLASLLRSGLTIRQALVAWPDELPERDRKDPLGIRDRLTLGSSVPAAVASLSSRLGAAIAPVVGLHVASGGDAAAALDRVAEGLEEESVFLREAKTASSGARLSARLVAGLPLAFVPFSPAARGALADPVGIMMLLVGVGLGVAGLRWIGRLVPGVPEPDPVTHLCATTATLLRAGLSLDQALRSASAHPPPGLEGELARAYHRVRLGQPWRRALAGPPAQLDQVGRAVERAQRAGAPVAAALEQVAVALRAERRLAFEARLRRAPVLMVVPLTCCILPAYGLLAIGPFLRSVTLS